MSKCHLTHVPILRLNFQGLQVVSLERCSKGGFKVFITYRKSREPETSGSKNERNVFVNKR